MNEATQYVDEILRNAEYATNASCIVVVAKETIEKIKEFIPKLITHKLTEKHYKKDNSSMYKRMYTGFLGEAAVEQLIDRPIMDFSIGDSKTYDKADIFPLNVGIKTVEYGLYPLVRVNPKTGEIICVKLSDDTVVVCGYASLTVVKNNQDIELVKDYACKKRGTKAGFNGFQYLKRFESLEQLKQLLKDDIENY